MADLARKATQIADAHGGSRELVGKIALALRDAYDAGLRDAREQAIIEAEDSATMAEKERCHKIATACQHMMYED